MEIKNEWRRTHTCGELSAGHKDAVVVLAGWVHQWRNHGGVIFINVRDRYGITQVLFDPKIDPNVWKNAEILRHEFVISVRGTVALRPSNMINPKMATGEIEVVACDLLIHSESEAPPIQILNEEREDFEETRLRYRYLDLRRPSMQNNIIFRHHVVAEARKYLWEKDFLEIETPILMKSTPEGARDFLVPSRLNPGKFYALPQSPQTYKQLLMVAGFGRYFQIARCFRDEDLRADRQPEFTQIDAELSFVDEEDIYSLFEGLMSHVFGSCLKKSVDTPFPRISHDQAFRMYGTDKPDLRFGIPIIDVTEELRNSSFKVFASIIAQGGAAAALAVPASCPLSRKQIDMLAGYAGRFGAKGLIWFRVKDVGMESPVVKFLSEVEIAGLREKTSAQPGDTLLIIAAPEKICFTSLGQVRLEVSRLGNLVSSDCYQFVWVHNFPLFEYSDEEQRYVSVHHPFTAPVADDIALMDGENFYAARARAYDLVLNGTELGGGSIRIHRQDMQKKVFRLLGIDEDEAERKFGFLLQAFRYGAPPHGGIAFGLDRLVMLMKNAETIRDVLAFPKTAAGLSLMDGAPDPVSEKQLRELGIMLRTAVK